MPDRYRIKPGKKVDLSKWDANDTAMAKGKAAGRKASEKLSARLGELQELLYAEHRRRVLVVLQGMDTSGKDGTVSHVLSGMNPQGVRIASFKRPTEEELNHDFLWRIHREVPGNGEVVVFNRSHYEDVLVVRVHKLVPDAVWRARYEQIRNFERELVASGTVILKFFLHIDLDEQKQRLQARIDDPTKRWKFQHGDLDERKLWADYQDAYEEALSKTSTDEAPWYVIPANAKWYRNLLIGRIMVDTLEGLGMKYPVVDVSGIVIE